MNKKSRLLIVLGVLALSFVFLQPTLRWYFWTSKEDKALALSSREKIKDYAKNMAHSAVSDIIDAAKAGNTDPLDSKYDPLVADAKQQLKQLGKPIPEQWNAIEVIKAFPSRSEAEVTPVLERIMENAYRTKVLKIKDNQTNAVKLGLDLSGGMSVIIKADLDAVVGDRGLSDVDAAAVKKEAMDLAVQTLSSRIDKFGLSEPVIRKQGEDRIYVEMPGAADADSINSIIMGRGLLAFHMVDDDATTQFRQYYAAHPTTTFDADYNLLDPSIIPEDCMVLGVYEKDAYGLDERSTREPFLAIKKEVGLAGKHITDVSIVPDPTTNKPQVIFELDSEGAEIFADLTTKNAKKRLAIISDGKIKSAPVIKTPIVGGRGSIDGFSSTEAENLRTVLRTAWLNVPLRAESQQEIGASLGEKTIQQGLTALTWGLLAVFAFMLLWYLEAGVNACIAQVLNLYIVFSVLSAFNLTLTLPSIAGMILTIGMAVDANVIIFERAKEELRLNKGRAAALSAGFSRAFWAIMDSNITTFIAALFLSVLGTGPIKGFAYSLAIGVTSSVFTALFVSRLIFDFGTETLKRKRVFISWRKLSNEKN